MALAVRNNAYTQHEKDRNRCKGLEEKALRSKKCSIDLDSLVTKRVEENGATYANIQADRTGQTRRNLVVLRVKEVIC